MEIVFIIGIAQGLFFSMFLFIKKNNLLANRILIGWLFCLCFSLFLNYLYISKHIIQYPHLIGLDTALPFLYGPLLFLYCKYLSQSIKKFTKQDSVHFISFFVYFIYVSVQFYSQNGSYKLEYLNNIHSGNLPIDLSVAVYLKFIQASVYLYFTVLLIKKHKKTIADYFSETHKINLSWLQTLTYSLIVIYILKFCGIVLPFWGFAINLGETEGMSDLFVVVFVFMIAFKGYQQQEIFKDQPIDEEYDHYDVKNNLHMVVDNREYNIPKESPKEHFPTETEPIPKPRYANSALSHDMSIQLFSVLTNYMLTEKPYLNAKVSLNEIAQAIKISTKNLSQIINEHTQQNFFNYINMYRIKEVKLRMSDQKYSHLSILGIALDCGFNSKSAFNQVFKKLTHQTPSEYLKSLKTP